MAKGKIDMSKLTLGAAKPIKKKSTKVVKKEAIADEVAVQKIHDKDDGKPSPPAKEPLVRITVDVFKSMHKAIKMKAMNNDVTIREYIVTLVERDLGI